MQGLTASRPGCRSQVAAEFGEADAAAVKTIERETNHDVKAVEYFIKDKLGQHAGWRSRLEFVHFACTSEDINNLSYALLCAAAREKVLLPRLDGPVRRAARHGARARRRRDDGPHARATGHADDTRQGSGRLRAPSAPGPRRPRGRARFSAR